VEFVEPPDIPISLGRIVRDLALLGVAHSQTLLVHVSLSAIGSVEGGAGTVVAALREAVGAFGNIVVLTSTEENSLTSRKHYAEIHGMPPDVMQKYLREMPPFDVRSTPCGTGAVAEALRTTAGAVRSAHPQSSFAAIGPDAERLMAGHRLTCHHGEYSPLAKMYDLSDKARVLMIGVGYQACTAIHLAEYRYRPDPPMRKYDCVVSSRGAWETYEDVVLDDSRFADVGRYIESQVFPRFGAVGAAMSRLIPLQDVVDQAVKWMQVHRG
jgi:aminoglycoside 3-N-acetyltransferase